MKKGYSVDSLNRALDHHVKGGRLRGFQYQPFMNARRPWRVEGNRGTPLQLTDNECTVLVYGLASADCAEVKS
jgi:hypothetical protein